MTSDAKNGRAVECEIRTADGWRVIGIDEARRAPEGSELRCMACGGKLRIHGAFYGDGGSAFFKHYRAHDGCPFLARSYSGTPSRHPEALI